MERAGFINYAKCSVAIFIAVLLFPFYATPQENGNAVFSYPLDVPMSLSGTYGELC